MDRLAIDAADRQLHHRDGVGIALEVADVHLVAVVFPHLVLALIGNDGADLLVAVAALLAVGDMLLDPLTRDQAAVLSEVSVEYYDVPAELNAPAGKNWRVWLYLAGRGAGKTRSGAEWVKHRSASSGDCRAGTIPPRRTGAGRCRRSSRH